MNRLMIMQAIVYCQHESAKKHLEAIDEHQYALERAADGSMLSALVFHDLAASYFQRSKALSDATDLLTLLLLLQPRPTSAPAAIRQVSVAVDLPPVTRQKAAICNATGNDVPIIRDYILRAQIDSALDELNWWQMSTNHLWLDMAQGEVSNG